MDLSLSLSKISPQITKERLKGYKLILFGQLTVLVSFLFVYELFHRYPFAGWQPLLLAVIGLIMIVMNILSYQLMKDLTDNIFLQKMVFNFLWLGLLLPLFIGFGFIESDTFLYKAISAISVSFSILAFIFLLYFMIFDIFNEKHDIIYRLWGSASIYLLIGSVFGLLYTLLEIFIPNEFQIDTPYDIFHTIPLYNFSFYNLAGIDCPYEGFSLLVKNVAVIETIFSNLYIVLVVGRLLSK